MAKWVTLIFPFVNAKGERHPVCAPSLGGLALARVKTGVFSLLHIKASAVVVTIEGRYTDVRRLSEDIVNLTDWEQYSTRDEIMAVDGLADRVRAVMLSASNEDEREAGHA